MILIVPWVTRGVTLVDRWLVRGLLGPGRLGERVRHSEETRTRMVDDSTTALRRIERTANIFAKLGLPLSESDNRRVLAVLRYLQS